MRIGIDISQVVYETGVATYTKNLVKTLLEIDKTNEYVLFGGTLRQRPLLNKFISTLRKESFESKVFPIPPTITDLIWNRWHVLPIERLIGEVDVLHSSDWAQPPSSAFKVTTIHDLVPFKYPELSHPKIVLAHKARLKWIIKEIDRVIVPSKTTQGDLVNFGFNNKIVVIPEAPDPVYKPVAKSKIESQKKRYKIKGRYLLAVGVNSRKNTERIIQAFSKLKILDKLNLVIIGHPFIKIKPSAGVIMLGHGITLDMPTLYSGAEALIYPSLYEGFGLPILEAFACRTPVVTSNLGSMKEIAGDAAVLVNPKKTDSISEGIEKILKEREIYIKMGVKRVKTFSWTKTAKKTLEVYRETKNI